MKVHSVFINTSTIAFYLAQIFYLLSSEKNGVTVYQALDLHILKAAKNKCLAICLDTLSIFYDVINISWGENLCIT